VPAGERDALFDSFVRFDTGGRAGLGLAIAKTFLEAHGERIWVEGAPSGGARFVFTVPVAAGEGPPE
jgi:signal transduction histidine kinase